MLGRAAVVIWFDVAPGDKAEFDDWHTHEHMPERLGIPGFRRGSRWLAADGGEGYFNLYEADNLATISSGPYLERLNNPTPWSRKMMPRHRNMVRSLCEIRASHGAGLGPFLLTLRFAPGSAGLEAVSSNDCLAALPGTKGIAAAHLLKADNTKLATQTTEQKIRGGDGTADWIVLVTGYERSAIADVSADLEADAIAGIYALGYMLVGGERP